MTEYASPLIWQIPLQRGEGGFCLWLTLCPVNEMTQVSWLRLIKLETICCCCPNTRRSLVPVLKSNGSTEHVAHVLRKKTSFVIINETVDVNKYFENYPFRSTRAHRILSHHLITLPCFCKKPFFIQLSCKIINCLIGSIVNPDPHFWGPQIWIHMFGSVVTKYSHHDLTFLDT